MQFRHHGSTKGEVWEGIRLEDLADDVFRFLVSLDLSFLGLSQRSLTFLPTPSHVADCSQAPSRACLRPLARRFRW